MASGLLPWQGKVDSQRHEGETEGSVPDTITFSCDAAGSEQRQRNAFNITKERLNNATTSALRQSLTRLRLTSRYSCEYELDSLYGEKRGSYTHRLVFTAGA